MAIAVLILVSGCEAGVGPLTPVHGQVVFRGQVLHTGVIVFTPDPSRGSSGPVARGTIQVDGTYQLTTGTQPGAVAGWHRITVVALEEPIGTAPDGQFQVPRSLLPDRYRDPELSGLAREVKAGDENEINIDLD
jgi:hypothetical protein